LKEKRINKKDKNKEVWLNLIQTTEGISYGNGTQFETNGETAYRFWIQNERCSDELARGQLSLLAEMEKISNQ
jgi:hypothetical protein